MINSETYYLIDPIKLVQTEEIMESNVENLQIKIVAEGRWTAPIIVHERELFIMDGHHRLEVAKRLDLKFVPVLLTDYDRIDVTAWREGEHVTPDGISAMARCGQKYPYKTTRHIFRGDLPRCNIPLAELTWPQLEHSSPPPTPEALAMVAGFI